MRRFSLSFLLLGSCSILVQRAPLCGDGTQDPGEICFSEERLAVDQSPVSVELVDLDGDLDLDIVNSNFNKINTPQSTITVSLNDGTGTFASPTSFIVSDNPIQLVIADFTGDQKLDIAVVCGGFQQNSLFVDPSRVNLLEGDGKGQFPVVKNILLADPLLLSTFVGGQTLAAGDLNGDTLADLVVLNRETKNLAVLFNAGGTFDGSVSAVLDTVVTPFGVTLGDVDNDLDLDIVSTDNIVDLQQGIAGTSVKIFQNNGDSTFSAPTLFDVGVLPNIPVLGDLDADGDLDLVVTNGLSNNVSVLTNNSAAGQLSFALQFVQTGQNPIGVILVDLDLNQSPEIVVAENNDNNLRVLVNDGKALFASLLPIQVGGSPTLLSAGDLNNDGIIDLVVANSFEAQLSVLLSTP
jgi:hypothetical protein